MSSYSRGDTASIYGMFLSDSQAPLTASGAVSLTLLVDSTVVLHNQPMTYDSASQVYRFNWAIPNDAREGTYIALMQGEVDGGMRTGVASEFSVGGVLANQISSMQATLAQSSSNIITRPF